MDVFSYRGRQIIVLKGDITDVEADAIVNAANRFLKHGGGVAAAIVKKGGYIIQKESNKIVAEMGPLEVGEAVATTAGKLKAKKVIHTVGPMYGEGNEREKLIKAVYNSLRLADSMGFESIAFPAISTGIYRVPLSLASNAIIDGIKLFIDENPETSIKKILLVLYTTSAYDVFRETSRKKLGKSI